ncbi:juvenile hormone esterase-like [Oratosquilla oratoria]|uniref:juvenile hormone esterase-like n=1 Tax=Oratosquilla oratoria TaxID=337810 RepID=UPI003F76C4A4
MNVVKQCVVLVVALSLLEMAASQKGGKSRKGWKGDLLFTLDTAQGPITGDRDETAAGDTYFVYAGIPYAKPPVGNLRFKDPEVWENWYGLRYSHSKPPCALTNGGIDGDEDCLYLDVHAPLRSEGDPDYPVMVFFEGGPFTRSDTKVYSPRTFVAKGIVFVIVQYRIGVFGFLSTEDSVIPGNFGLKDQTMALRWVQANIKYYGGDPNQVTIMGQSARGASVMFHILSPHSTELFSKAIMMSGSGLAPWAMGHDFRRIATAIAQRFNCPIQSQEMLHCLQQLDTSDFADVLKPFYEWLSLPRFMGHRVDGDYIPDDPRVLLEQGNYNHVDIISGITKDEGGYVVDFLESDQARFEYILNNFTRLATLNYELTHEASDEQVLSSILQFYLGRTTPYKTDAEALARISGDVQFVLPHYLHTQLLLRSSRDGPGKVFLYELEHVGEYSIRSIRTQKPRDVNDTHVYHGDDLLYIFDFDGLPLRTPEDLEVRDLMVSFWANFVKTGTPTPPTVLYLTWDPATEANLEYLVIKYSSYGSRDQRAELRRFWANLPVRDFHLLNEREIVQTKGAAYQVTI